VPEFGQKQDAVPGIETELVITPTKVGEYTVVCTELCGLGHAVMRTKAIVMQPGRFETWLAAEGDRVAGGGEDAGAAIFTSNGCGGCHTFEPAGATGQTGPDLDDLPDDPDFVRESIVDPNAEIADGFQPNVMPQTYSQLSDEELDALVQYLVEGANE
jgi:cytochrome c oxidase subunit 2